MSSPSSDTLCVCIVAENASFRFGGEASLPLHYFTRLRATGTQVWLVVHSRVRAELEALLPADQDRIRYVPDRWFHKLIYQLSRPLPRRVSEATFHTLMVLVNQLMQRAIIRRLIRDEGVNVIHQPIPVSPKAPSLIYGLGVPVIVGPMNGGMEYPPAFRRGESRLTRFVVALARMSANVINSVIRGKKDATLLLVANERTRLALPHNTRGRVIEIPENGVDLRIWTWRGKSSSLMRPARFLAIGRLVDWKRLDIAIEAVARIPQAELEIIGEGPRRLAWTELTRNLRITERVRFVGWLSQQECAERLRSATALLLPSVYECGGAVVLEAMACGVPVVATSWGGPADYINATCGFLVDTASRETIVDGFTNAMRKLIADPVLCDQLGAAGRQRVEDHFDWAKKIDQILSLYREALNSGVPPTVADTGRVS